MFILTSISITIYTLLGIFTYMWPLAFHKYPWFPRLREEMGGYMREEEGRHQKPSPHGGVAKWSSRQVFSPRAALYPPPSALGTNQRAWSPVLINPHLGFNSWNRVLGKLNGFSTKDSLNGKNDYILLNLICEPSGSITFNGTSRTSVPSEETLIHKDTGIRGTLEPRAKHRKVKHLGAGQLCMVFLFPLVMLTRRDRLGLKEVGCQTKFLKKFPLEKSSCSECRHSHSIWCLGSRILVTCIHTHSRHKRVLRTLNLNLFFLIPKTQSQEFPLRLLMNKISKLRTEGENGLGGVD